MSPQQPAGSLESRQLVALLLLLSFTTGLVDAITVLGLGKVFTANMTGNVVFLGFAAAGVPGFKVISHLLALGGFLVGAVVGSRFHQLHADHPPRRWLMHSALLEAVLLWAAAIAALRFDVASQQPQSVATVMILLTAIAMGFRNATIRRVAVPDLTTTVLTMTITGLAADSRVAGGRGTNWGRRVLAIAAIFVGALSGAILVQLSGLALPLAIAGALALVGTAACGFPGPYGPPARGAS